jgi:hypothetical protein
MTHVSCSSCRLRFSPAVAAQLVTCPECGDALDPIADVSGLIGFRLFTLQDLPAAEAEAIAVRMPIPDLTSGPS